MGQKPRRVTSGKLSLAVEVFGTGPPLLFAHGLGSCRHQMHRMLEALADHFQVIVFDQRGHCESTPISDASLFDPHQMAGDIVAVLDHLEIDEAIVGGESMGAATALLFAIAQPKRVTRLLQIAPTASDEPNPGRDMIIALADFAATYGLAAAADAVALAAMGRGIPRAAAQMITARWADHHLDSFVLANRTVPNWVLFDSLAPVAALRMPIAVFGWGGDPSRPLSLARRMAAAARHGRFESIESLAEMAQQPSLYADTIRRLVDG